MKNRLQELRWKKNWSQLQLARISGVAQSQISRIENKEEIPNVLVALKLAKALRVNVEDIFTL